MKLERRTVLITGGTRGNTVIVTSRDQDRLAATAQALPGVHTFTSDVSGPRAIEALYAAVLSRFAALDTLTNNAGIMRNLKLNEERELEDVTREINFSGPVWMVQQLLPHLKTRPGALIVNVSSGLAFIPFPRRRSAARPRRPSTHSRSHCAFSPRARA